MQWLPITELLGEILRRASMGMDDEPVTMGWRMKGKLRLTGRGGLAGSLAMTLLLLSVMLSIFTGCQPVFISKEVYQDAYSKSSMLPAKAFEDNHEPITKPLADKIATPATVDFPERRQRHLTLQEAIAQALENGLPSGNVAEGTGNRNLLTFNGPGTMNNQTDRLRVLALNPAISNAAMEVQLARF